MATAGWADLYGWQVDRTNATPLFQQIYLQIRSAIVSRTLAPGLRLPSTRGLASRLQVARASVISAYEQLLAEGYIVGRARSGTFISSDLPASEPQVPRRGIAAQATRPSVAARFEAFERVRAFPAEADAVPFNMGRTRVDERTAATWRKLTTRAVRSLNPIHLGYSDPRGLPELREQLCEYLRAARAVHCDPDQIIVTTGTQSAIDLVIRTLLERDTEVWVEDPCYPVTYQALETAGVTIRHVPVDAHGMDVSAGIRSAPKARVAFVLTVSCLRRCTISDRSAAFEPRTDGGRRVHASRALRGASAANSAPVSESARCAGRRADPASTGPCHGRRTRSRDASHRLPSTSSIGHGDRSGGPAPRNRCPGHPSHVQEGAAAIGPHARLQRLFVRGSRRRGSALRAA